VVVDRRFLHGFLFQEHLLSVVFFIVVLGKHLVVVLIVDTTAGTVCVRLGGSRGWLTLLLCFRFTWAEEWRALDNRHLLEAHHQAG